MRIYIDSNFVCGGSILNNSLIITSAHCVMNGKIGYIIAGDLDQTLTEVNEQIINVWNFSKISIKTNFPRNTLSFMISDNSIDHYYF